MHSAEPALCGGDADIPAVFRFYDSDCTGLLLPAQMKLALIALVGSPLPKADMKKLRIEHPLGIDLPSFTALVQQVEAASAPAQRTRAMFNALDSEGKGYVTINDLRAAFRSAGILAVPDHVIDEIYYNVNSRHNDRVTFEDFNRMVALS
eukprot:gnl/Spiro4/15801_TR8499_c0_g1_i2.p1 gnl/Spiro4/15801_TR8499_c0_g1~~gnl/Spiro4/15801_TR8499_c0_g1_i2.p1  ORF type:complete len:150 (+),score=29.31 gnl/Spiro4/15801_TR8499_c0_g1_i2:74-523(+)